MAGKSGSKRPQTRRKQATALQSRPADRLTLVLRDVFQAEVGRGSFPENEFLNLSAGGERIAFYELNVFGNLESRNIPFTEATQLLGVCVRTRLELHRRGDFLAITRARYAIDRHITHSRVGSKILLELFRIDVLTATNDHVFDPAGYDCVTFLIHAG